MFYKALLPLAASVAVNFIIEPKVFEVTDVDNQKLPVRAGVVVLVSGILSWVVYELTRQTAKDSIFLVA